MQRRNFIAGSAGALALLAGGATVWIVAGEPLGPLNVEAALAEIDRLRDKELRSIGAWSPGRIFLHCAQSIDCSLTSYPEPKSALFQSTVGRAAWSAFSARGRLSHSLSDPIPGVPEPDANAEPRAALLALRTSFERFRVHAGALAPHFAYGPLDKPAYERAHVMHFYDHLREIQSV